MKKKFSNHATTATTSSSSSHGSGTHSGSAPSSVDVLIIGGGPVGLMCALEASRCGAKSVRVVDMLETPMEICKASTVWPRTMELLKYGHPDVYQQMWDYGNHVARIAIYRGKKKEKKDGCHVRVGRADEETALLSSSSGTRGKASEDTNNNNNNNNSSSVLARLDLEGKFRSEIPTSLCLEQFMTERFLRESLERRFGVVVERGVRVTHFQDLGGCVRVDLSSASSGETTETVQARYLVGCDGAHSFVRRHLNLNYPGEAFEDRVFWIMHGVVKGLPMASGEIWTVLHDEGFVFAVPMPGEDTWELIVDLDQARRNEFFGPTGHPPRDPTVPELLRLLRERVHGVDEAALAIPEEHVQWLGHFRIHSRQVERYSVGRVFLCGDACHVHSPVGGQGMNFGMQDAINLGWKLGMVLRRNVGQVVAKPSLLRSYHDERWPVAHQLVRMTELQTKLIVSPSMAARTLQYWLLPILLDSNSDQVADKMAPVAGETIYSYRTSSPLSQEHWKFESLSNVFSNLFFKFDPTRILQRRRVGITRFLSPRTRAGDRLPDASLTDDYGTTKGRAKQNIKTFSKWRLLCGGDDYDHVQPTHNDHTTNRKTLQSLCSSHNGFTALLFEAAPGYADESFGHGGQEVADLSQVAWQLETLLCYANHSSASSSSSTTTATDQHHHNDDDGFLIHTHIIASDQHDAHRALGIKGQCLVLVRPDGYVAFRSQPVDVAATVRYLQRIVGVVLPDGISMNVVADDEDETSSKAVSAELTNMSRILGATLVLTVANLVATVYFNYRRS